MKIKDLIIKQEKALLTYEVRHSVEKLKSLLSDDFMEIGSSGNIYNLENMIKELSDEENLSATIDNVSFKRLCDDIVLLTYKAFVVEGLEDKGTYSFRSSIWKNESGKWKMIFHQGTRCS